MSKNEQSTILSNYEYGYDILSKARTIMLFVLFD